jgi:hypothetical protein
MRSHTKIPLLKAETYTQSLPFSFKSVLLFLRKSLCFSEPACLMLQLDGKKISLQRSTMQGMVLHCLPFVVECNTLDTYCTMFTNIMAWVKRGFLRGVRCTISIRVVFLLRLPPSSLYSTQEYSS